MIEDELLVKQFNELNITIHNYTWYIRRTIFNPYVF